MIKHRIWKRLVLSAIWGIVAASSIGLPPGAASRTSTVITVGTTIVLEGNVARARDMAIANGKRKALEEVVDELIPEGLAIEHYDRINRSIYQRPEYFIDTYRILSEAQKEESVYEATLESAVAVDRVRKTLASLGLIEEDVGGELSYFELEVVDVSCSSCFEALQEYLENEMGGVEEVSLYAMRPGRFTLVVGFKGRMEAFREALLYTYFGGFFLDPEGMDENRIRVRMVLAQPEHGQRRSL